MRNHSRSTWVRRAAIAGVLALVSAGMVTLTYHAQAAETSAADAARPTQVRHNLDARGSVAAL